MEKRTFQELNLSNAILRAVEDMGFEEATSIQSQCIPLILAGKDVIGHSQTGTGKTAAFGIPALELINPESIALQVLILCPTRELAIQANDEIRKYAKYKEGIKSLPIYGGQSIDRQMKALKDGVQIVIGTPGRIMDHMRRHTIKMGNVKMVVLDEADEMLNMGFREDMETILKDVPQERQTILFSATISDEILKITKEYQKDPELVKVVHKQLTIPSIEQNYYEIKKGSKMEVLSRLLDLYNPKLSLVFCNTKKMVDDLVIELQSRGYSAGGLHGDLKQQSRTNIMNSFRQGAIDILVATDVAARGIDIENVEAVFNYDIPQDVEYYVHRIGRTGRAGREGRAFTFVTGKKDIYNLKEIQRYTNSKIHLQSIPTISDIQEIKINQFVQEIKTVLHAGELTKYIEVVDQLMEEEYTSVDIAAALIKMTIGKEETEEIEPLENFQETKSNSGMVRLFINVGKKDRIDVKDILNAIVGKTGIQRKVVGAIDILDKFTFVDVPKENEFEVLKNMKNAQIKGREVSVELAQRRR